MVELFIMILLLLFFSIYLIYYKIYSNDNLIYVKSLVDNNYYWVRNLKNHNLSVNTLATIRLNMVKLVSYLSTNIELFPDNMSYIKDMVQRTKIINITEASKDEKYTSYTINKGEKIVFCLRSKIFNKIEDMNTLMYVVIHEMGHIGCPEFGHTDLFKKIFKFLLQQSIKIGIYKAVDYRIYPQSYCGMIINEYLLD